MTSIKPAACQEDIAKTPLEGDILDKLVKILRKYASIEALSFDVVQFERLEKESLKRNIKNDGVVLYERENH